jgi:hypothetical protein
VIRCNKVSRAAVTFVVWTGLGAGACGKVSGSSDASPPPDAPRRCDVDKPFGPATPITELNTSALEDGAWLSSDELTIYFSTTRDGSFDIYTATRSSPTGVWTRITPVAGVNTSDMMERGPVLTPDGLTMYATRQIGSDYNLLVSTLTSERFGPFRNEPSLNAMSPDIDDSPSQVLADRTILFESNRAGATDLYQATWGTNQEYTEITMLGGLEYRNDAGERSVDGGPKLTGDKLTLYWTSNRESSNSEDYNIWVATRPIPSGSFSNPMKLNINTDALDSASWISADGCVIYFISQIAPPGQPVNYDMYSASKPL